MAGASRIEGCGSSCETRWFSSAFLLCFKNIFSVLCRNCRWAFFSPVFRPFRMQQSGSVRVPCKICCDSMDISLILVILIRRLVEVLRRNFGWLRFIGFQTGLGQFVFGRGWFGSQKDACYLFGKRFWHWAMAPSIFQQLDRLWKWCWWYCHLWQLRQYEKQKNCLSVDHESISIDTEPVVVYSSKSHMNSSFQQHKYRYVNHLKRLLWFLQNTRPILYQKKSKVGYLNKETINYLK